MNRLARFVRRCVGVALLPALCTFASAQDTYPSRTITIVVPTPPGGVVDVVARPYGVMLSKRLGKPVVLDYKTGANGNIGAAHVARTQPADGYTLLFGGISTMVINPHLYTSLPFDPLTDLQPITNAFQAPNVLVANVQSPYKTLGDVVAAAKAKPGTISFGSGGNGNTTHLLGLQLGAAAGISLVHVPYKGGPPALADMMAGHIPLMIHALSAVADLHKQGRVRILAVADRQRSPQLPDVPTIAEAGVPGVVSLAWTGILMRAGTPSAIVERISRESQAILQDPAFRAPLEAQGFQLLSTTPREFGDRMRTESAAFSTLIKANNIRID
jgi:tripartite-type tricarboxylate transporter receptor subunit TctC